MLHLVTTVRLRGVVVECRSLAVSGPFLVGEHPEARVAFPGLTLPVAPLPAEPHPVLPNATREAGVAVGGIVLTPGHSHTLRNGPVEVEFTVERAAEGPSWAPPAGREAVDLRLLVACAALVVFALWVETGNRWLATSPAVQAEVASLSARWRSTPADDAPAASPEVRLLPVDFSGSAGNDPE